MPYEGRSVFLSYRRADSQPLARLLADHLQRQLPGLAVFVDVEAIVLGASFAAEIGRAITASDLLLVVVGPDWPATAGRLVHPEDFVALEMRTARARGIPVIPVVDAHARMPQRSELPPDLQWFAQLQAFFLHTDIPFAVEVQRLAARLRTEWPPAPPPPVRPSVVAAGPAWPHPAGPAPTRRSSSGPWVAVLVVALIVALLGGGGLVAWRLVGAPYLTTTTVNGRWSAPKLHDATITVTRVSRLRNRLTFDVQVDNRGSAPFALSIFDGFQAFDNLDHSYGAAPEERTWTAQVAAHSTLRAQVELDRSVPADATSVRLLFSHRTAMDAPLDTVTVAKVPVPRGP